MTACQNKVSVAPQIALPLLVFALCLSPTWVAKAIAFYVSPKGNDAWSGTKPSPAFWRKDGPFASLPAAVQAARAARANGDAQAGILVRDGTYDLAEPLVLTPEDSGASAEKPFVIAAYRGEKPVISGGQRITGWKPVAGRPGVWQAEVPAVRAGQWSFRSLFVNGQRAVRARIPNEGSFFQMDGARFSDKPCRFKFKPGDIRPAWAEARNVEVVALEKWTDIRQHLRAVDSVSNVVTLSGASSTHTREAQARYWIENTADALDAPGEWFLDRTAGTLFYIPRTDENLASAEIIAPRLQELVLFRGDFEAKNPVRHVVLRGLTFRHTDWTMSEEGFRDPQAAVGFAGDVLAEGAVDCAIEDCTFSQLAGYAVDFARGCQRNRIVGNELFDLGAGGVRLGETGIRPDPFEQNHGNVVTDNHIHHAGRVFPPAVGVLVLQSGTNRVAHNHIHDLYYTAISVGWTWGYRESPCRENLIEFNHLHDLGQEMLSDMGGIYTLGIQRGTVLRNNLIHDVRSFGYGGWGLYTDEGSSHIVLESNVVYHCKSAGFHQHYGRENVVRNNIFAFNQENQLMRTRAEEHLSFTFEQNIVCFDSGKLLGSNWSGDQFRLDRNCYFDARPGAGAAELKFANGTLADWRKRGQDVQSVIADPRFVAPERCDFRLREDSPALKLGFQPIDLRQVGVRSGRRP